MEALCRATPDVAGLVQTMHEHLFHAEYDGTGTDFSDVVSVKVQVNLGFMNELYFHCHYVASTHKRN